MRKYKYLLFDLDGTLVYSHPGIFACFRYALEKMGGENPSDEALKGVIGPSLLYSFQTFFGMNEEDARRAVALYRERYSVKGVWENVPVEGALACLQALKKAGYIFSLATSKPMIYAEKILEKHGFAPYFDEAVGPDVNGGLSTKAEVIAEAIKRLHAAKEECLMIGDRYYDAEGARETGVDCALLKVGGYAAEQELYTCGAAYVFADFAELSDFLLGEKTV